MDRVDIAIVGGGLAAAAAAGSYRKAGGTGDVTIFTQEPERTGVFIQRYVEARGVRFLFDTGVHAFEGDGRVETVVTSDGTSIPADLVVVGVGAALNVELAEEAGLRVDRGVMVDDLFRTSHPDIYAVGDIANFPDPIAGQIHLEHWDNALAQGRAVGKTLAGQPEPFRHVAYFFSDLFDLSLNMVGYPAGWDDIELRGDPEAGGFTTVYIRHGRVRAALMVNDDADFDHWTAVVAAETPVEEMKSPPRLALA